MVECDEEYRLDKGHYECVVSQRDAPSVSKLISLLYRFILILNLILHSAKFLGFTKEQQDLAKDYFKNLGPIPRLFIDFVKNPAQFPDYEMDHEGKITGLTSNSLRRFAHKGGDLDLDAESHKLFLIRQDELDDLTKASIGPIMANVGMEIMRVINKMRWCYERTTRIVWHLFLRSDAA